MIVQTIYIKQTIIKKSLKSKVSMDRMTGQPVYTFIKVLFIRLSRKMTKPYTNYIVRLSHSVGENFKRVFDI